jgi:FkbM family methyltransferase
MLRYLRPGDHFADVGANVGAYSVFAATFVGNIGITAVEPDSPTRERLRENLALNGVLDPLISDCVLGDHTGTITFSSGRDSLNSIVDPAEEGAVTLPMTTLDSLLERTPAVVKIDVEGAEQEVLKGATEMLSAAEPPALIMELNGLCERFGASPASIRKLLAGFGYKLYEYDGTANRLTVFESDGYPPGKNVIALSSSAATKERLDQLDSGTNYRVPISIEIDRG